MPIHVRLLSGRTASVDCNQKNFVYDLRCTAEKELGVGIASLSSRSKAPWRLDCPWDLRLVYNVMLVFACISSHKNLHCLERDGQSNLFGLPALKILRSTLTCEKSSP